MNITLNGNNREIAQRVTVREFLEDLKLKPETVAVEVNLAIVSKNEYDTRRLDVKTPGIILVFGNYCKIYLDCYGLRFKFQVLQELPDRNALGYFPVVTIQRNIHIAMLGPSAPGRPIIPDLLFPFFIITVLAGPAIKAELTLGQSDSLNHIIHGLVSQTG